LHSSKLELRLSALGQKQTHAVQQKGLLFEHRVGAGQQ